MKVGDLVIVRYYNEFIHKGIIVKVGTFRFARDVLVAWNDGTSDWINKGNVKVISESR